MVKIIWNNLLSHLLPIYETQQMRKRIISHIHFSSSFHACYYSEDRRKGIVDIAFLSGGGKASKEKYREPRAK